MASRSTLPILGHVLLSVSGETLTLTTTDLELRFSYGISIERGADGAITVPGKLLQALIGKMSDDDPVQVQARRGLEAADSAPWTQLVITCGEATYTLYGLPAEEYPVVELPDDLRRLLLPGPQLVEMIRRVQYAVSTDESRPVICGALFRWEPEAQTLPSPQPPPNTGEGEPTIGMATLAATDTHRLAVDRQPLTAEVSASR